MIYSGKGGVGKTTTTSNIARSLTEQGSVVLFAYEVLPVTMANISAYMNEGYKLSQDGRYIPTKEHVEMLYNAFGDRVGLSDNWEEQYNRFY